MVVIQGMKMVLFLYFSDSLKYKNKTIFIPCISVVGSFGQAVLWSRQVKSLLHFSEGTSEFKRKFLALISY